MGMTMTLHVCNIFMPYYKMLCSYSRRRVLRRCKLGEYDGSGIVKTTGMMQLIHSRLISQSLIAKHYAQSVMVIQ